MGLLVARLLKFVLFPCSDMLVYNVLSDETTVVADGKDSHSMLANTLPHPHCHGLADRHSQL